MVLNMGTNELAQNRRRRLFDGELLKVDELVARPELPPRGETYRRQLVITIGGAFEFQVGRSVTWIDPSRILFAEANQSYVDHHVVPRTGHCSVILAPTLDVMAELWGDARSPFAGRIRACSLSVQRLVQCLRRASEPLQAQELGVAIMEQSVAESRTVGTADTRCVRRAKAVLNDCPDGRLTLGEIAHELGVAPVYLTQCFKRSEGMPLYRYQTMLRLNRALNLLPERDDITDLAFELGFSSHSHFTAAFRSHLGLTPSRYRNEARAI